LRKSFVQHGAVSITRAGEKARRMERIFQLPRIVE
jgi:hypothetical protein